MTAVHPSFGYPVGCYPAIALGAVNFSTQQIALDGTGDEAGIAFYAQDTSAITHLGFRHDGNVSPPTYKISLQSLDVNGLPDGTIKGGGSPASATFDPSAFGTDTFQWIALDNSYTPSLGELLCIIIEYESGTIGASNFMSPTYRVTNMFTTSHRFPWGAFTTNNWSSRSSPGSIAPHGVRSASARYGAPLTDLGVGGIGTDGHREVCKFSLPNTQSSMTCVGLNVVSNPPTTEDFIIGLWDAAGDPLATVTIDEDYLSATTDGYVIVYFSSPVVLSPGTTYYAGIERTTVSCGLPFLTFTEANDVLCYPLGADSIWSTWNGSAWSDTTTQRPWGVDLMLKDVASGGGSPLGNTAIIGGGGVHLFS